MRLTELENKEWFFFFLPELDIEEFLLTTKGIIVKYIGRLTTFKRGELKINLALSLRDNETCH